MAASSAVSVRSYVHLYREGIVPPRDPEYEQLPLLPEGGGIDLAALRKEKAALKAMRRHSPHTMRAYAAGFRAFTAWCRMAGKACLPCSDETLSLYVTWMLQTARYRVRTAEVYINAVLDAHRRAGAAIPASKDAFEICAAIRRQGKEHSLGKEAMTVKHLRKACQLIASKDRDSNRARRDLAVLLFGFASSLRRSELAALDLEDVKFRGPGMAVRIRRAKNDQEGEGRIVGIWAGERPMTDPVRALRRWIEFRGDWEGPLFTNISRLDVVKRERMGTARICDVVKAAVARAGLDPTGYGAHSLRSGAITAAADRGMSDRELMRLSGHRKASSISHYVKESEVFSGRNPLPGAL